MTGPVGGDADALLVERAAEAMCENNEPRIGAKWKHTSERVRDQYRADARLAVGLVAEHYARKQRDADLGVVVFRGGCACNWSLRNAPLVTSTEHHEKEEESRGD